MDPETTYDAVASAYRKARLTPKSLVGKGTSLDAVRERLQELEKQSDRVLQIIDWKNRNVVIYENGEETRKNATVPITMERLLRVPSMDAIMGPFLYYTVRALQPRIAVEIGACIGVSSMYIAAALHDNGVGKLVTFEGDPTLAKIAEENIEQVAPGQGSVIVGPFDETVAAHVSELDHVDFAFSDQEHYLEPTMRDLNALSPKMREGALLLIDDIALSKYMKDTWDVVRRDPRCAINALPFRFGRAHRIGAWIRGDDQGKQSTRKILATPIDYPNPVMDALRGVRQRFR